MDTDSISASTAQDSFYQETNLAVHVGRSLENRRNSLPSIGVVLELRQHLLCHLLLSSTKEMKVSTG